MVESEFIEDSSDVNMGDVRLMLNSLETKCEECGKLGDIWLDKACKPIHDMIKKIDLGITQKWASICEKEKKLKTLPKPKIGLGTLFDDY